MREIKTPIVPIRKTIAKIKGSHELNLEAICVFVATGFFLDTDTYWKDEVVLRPGTTNTIDDDHFLIESKPWFQWHYSPREISFQNALEEFIQLFETIIEEQTKGKKVVLPLSGGLDSRTQAVALRNHPQVKTYSYKFNGGYPEDKIAKKIADACGFEFHSLTIPKGYLWNCIDELAVINKCYSEFTHPRQMAFIEKYPEFGDVFSLGHLGDFLFDSFELPQLSFNDEAKVAANLVLKKGGKELANDLWNYWELDGTFESYYEARIQDLLQRFNMNDTNAKLRAFKTKYSVASWSSNNLSIFDKALPITLPYYDDRMCAFICTVPENYLANRKLQIEYIKRKAPALAKITWQSNKPFNLYNYHLNKVPYNLPNRIYGKLKRELNVLLGKSHIQRNWELQFLGAKNTKNLKKYLFDYELDSLVPTSITQKYFSNFTNKDAVKYSHPMSMLLTLSLFQMKFNN